MPRYPKPEKERRNRSKPAFDWTELPSEGRDAPELPDWRKWQAGTLEWWSDLWSKPQSSQWEDDGSTLWALACLYDDLIAGRTEAAKVSSEMRQHEDRHGLNPKAMLQLRWRVADESAEEESRPRRAPTHLRAVDAG